MTRAPLRFQEPPARGRAGSPGRLKPLAVLVAVGVLVAVSCNRNHSDRLQGYVEGEFVYVSSPLSGTLEALEVERGDEVKAGQPLFALDRTPEKAAYEEAERRLAQARSTLEDLKKGRRPSEIASLEAQLEQARATFELAKQEFDRVQRLRAADAAASIEYQRAQAAHDREKERVAQLEADLQTARLGARPDQIQAAEAEVRALEAALAQAAWSLAQKTQAAPQSGEIFDTLYRKGEWVAAGRPVVALLPPANIKVRAFVPEPRIGEVHRGDVVRVFVDGVPEPFVGKVSFISPKAEFTPPVIYSKDSRAKLVFMVEAVFDPAAAARLNPGQPVDVELGP